MTENGNHTKQMHNRNALIQAYERVVATGRGLSDLQRLHGNFYPHTKFDQALYAAISEALEARSS